LLEGKRTVGSLRVTNCGAALLTSVQEGAAKLDVGSLKGRLKLHVAFQASGLLEHIVSATHGLGYVSNPHGSERIRVKAGQIPAKLGEHFKLILNTKLEPRP
jgi:hypothetical protein